MPSMDAVRRYGDLRRQEARTPKALYAVDATTGPGCPAGDLGALTAAASGAVAAGGGHVLETSHVRFPNGAITLVLILAESHLSIHTWPEEDLIAIDLFSCGAIDGNAVVERLIRSLGLSDASIREIRRGERALPLTPQRPASAAQQAHLDPGSARAKP